MKRPMFSIIVPIYGVEKFLKKCLDSILNQTFNDFEAILVDDGSKDQCPAICDEYASRDSRFVVIHKKNGGLVSARKAGTEKAIGQYIVCLDGDDWLHENCLKTFLKTINSAKPDVICCGYIAASGHAERRIPLVLPYGLYDRQKMKTLLFPQLIESVNGKYFRPQVWAKAYRRNIYVENQLQVPNTISIGEDHACTKPCIYHANSVYMEQKCLYYYRINESSMTKSRKPFSWEAPEAIGRTFEKSIDMDECDFQDQVYRNVVHNLFNVAVSQFNRAEKYTVIKKDILKNISKEYYENAIRNCRFQNSWKCKLAQMALRTKSIFLLYIFNKIGRS